MDLDSPIVIFCGGQGTRIREASERLPKAMVEIGGKPIIWHIMKIYSNFGYRRFILCLGYKGWEIKRFFLDYRAHMSDFTISMADKHSLEFHDDRADENWEITFAETGMETYTGARLYRVRHYIDTENFMLTYGDGVSTIDINALAKEHVEAGRIGTVTGVHPTSKFGEMSVHGDKVEEFNEKPTHVTGFASGGFFAFKREFLDGYLNDDPKLWLEQEPLQRLAQDGELTLYPHEDFWRAMDTYKDYCELNQMWESGEAPWRIWSDGEPRR